MLVGVLDIVGILVIVEVLDVEGTPGVVGFDVVDKIGVEDFGAVGTPDVADFDVVDTPEFVGILEFGGTLELEDTLELEGTLEVEAVVVPGGDCSPGFVDNSAALSVEHTPAETSLVGYWGIVAPVAANTELDTLCSADLGYSHPELAYFGCCP